MFQEPEETSALTQLVFKSNDLIQKSRFSLSLPQQKIILYLISKITPYDEDFKLYEFSIQEFCKICGIDPESGKNYGDLKKAIDEIGDKKIWIEIADDEETWIRWIEKPYLNKRNGIVKIRFDKDMKPYLLQLKESFTSYELIWTLHFKRKYSIRLYELIKSIHFRELEEYSREYDLAYLRRVLGAENYDTWQRLKDRVLTPAVKEINAYSDKTVDITPIKKGKSVESVMLTIKSKEWQETQQIRDQIIKEMGYEQMTLWDELEERNLV